MKKLLFLIIPLIIIVGYACEDRFIDPVVLPEVTYKAYKATAGIGGTIKPLSGKDTIGATVPFTVTEDVGHEVDSFFVNGVLTKLTNLKYNLKIEDSDYYDIIAIFKRTNLLPLIAHPWEFEARYRRFVGETDADWAQSYPGTWTYTFYKSGKYNKKWADGTGGDDNYLLKGDSLILGPNYLGNDGIRTKILVLNEDYMEILCIAKYAQSPGDPALPDLEVKEVYKKPKP